ILQKIALHHPDPPSHLREGIPRALDRVVLKLLEKDPARRYQDGASVALELVRLKPTQVAFDEMPVDPLATATRPQPPPQRAARSASMQAWLPAVIAGGVIIITAAILVRRPQTTAASSTASLTPSAPAPRAGSSATAAAGSAPAPGPSAPAPAFSAA